MAAYPSSTNYQLKAFGFGNGGTGKSTSTNYNINGITGELGSTAISTSTNYSLTPGLNPTQNANVPKIAISNPSSYYDKLLLVIDTQNNPIDATFAVSISSDNFVSDIRYVKSDNTLTSTLTFPTDYRTYSGWGSGSGTTIIGLASSTTYTVKAKAYQGNFTETGYGPTSSAATVGQQLSFCIYSNANCGLGGNTEAFGTIPLATPTNSPTNIGVDFSTNANNGGKVYIYGSQAGLRSNSTSYTIASATADLSLSGTEGFGAQIASVTNLTKVSPYNSSAQNVGLTDTSIREILTASAPVVGGTAAVTLKARTKNTTPAATDYADILTLIAAGIF